MCPAGNGYIPVESSPVWSRESVNEHAREGQRVRVRLPRDLHCEDEPHKLEEDQQAGTIVRCADRPGGPSHP